MKRLVVLLVLLLAAPLLAQQPAAAVQKGWFAAYAYNPGADFVYAGFDSWGPGGQTPLQAWRGAKHGAMDRCWEDAEEEGGGCRRAVWVYNGYIAVAAGDKQAWGSGWGEFRGEAKEAAEQSCIDHGGQRCRARTRWTVTPELDPQQDPQGGPFNVAPNVGRIPGG